MREFISSLDLPNDAKQRLLDLTPGTYTGLAANLAKTI
jgi:adenylosuccinate lyase